MRRPDDPEAFERHCDELFSEQGGGLRRLVELRKSGAVRAIGAGINGSETAEWQVQFAARLADESTRLGSTIDFILLAGTPTLLDHSAHTNGARRLLCCAPTAA